MTKIILSASLTVLLFTSPANFFPFSAHSNELTTMDLVEKIHENIQSTPEMNKWQVSVLTTLFKMDKNWEPKKKTVIEKLTIVENKKRIEKIIRATEYDKDKTRDMTAKYQAEAAKLNKKNESRKRENRRPKGRRRSGLDLTREELFPFGENRRKDYEFELYDDPSVDSQGIYVLETRSKQKSSDFYEGKYYIHPETFDVVRAELRPAKYPGPLKLLEMHIEFDRLPGEYLVIRKSKVRIHVGLIIKNIRRESEEIYSNYKVLD
jgi:hypothetical protein